MAQRGPKPKPKPEVPPEPTPAETWVALLEAVPPERQQQLRDAMLDKACGFRLFSAGDKRPGSTIAGTEVAATLTINGTGEVYEGWFYTVPPDPAAARLVLDHSAGKPAARTQSKSDLVVQIVHQVPRGTGRVPGPDEAAAEIEEFPETDAPRFKMVGDLEMEMDPEDVFASEEGA